MYESKDVIRNRMMRHISRMWGYPGIESEDAFDPVLGMIIGACAGELEKINKEIGFSQTRLTERIAQLFVPEAETRAVPAHTVVHVPLSNVEDTIDMRTTFVCSKAVQSGTDTKKNEEKSLEFIPTMETKIHNAEIKYLITNEFIYKQMEGRYKDIFAFAQEKKITESCFYLGIACSSAKQKLQDLSIFFELDEKSDTKELFFDNFKYAQFSVNGEAIKASSGFKSKASKQNLINEIVSNQNIFKTKIKDVNDFYSVQFINIEDIDQVDDKFKKCPDEVVDYFDAELVDTLDDNIIWLKIDFPSIVSPATLAHLTCHLNCVPAINCKLKSDSITLQKQLNLKALFCDDYFYDIKGIVDDSGNKYGTSSLLEENSNNKNEEVNYEYVLRTSGVGKLDQRKAGEMLQDLIVALKEESVAFSMYNSSNLLVRTEELNKQIATLEDLVSKKNRGENITYLMFKGNNGIKNKHLTIKYWETAGEIANDIKKGTNMKLAGISSFNGKSATLMVRTHQGRGHLSGDEKLQAFKKAYVANNRVVTMQDVKETVQAELGAKLKSVSVKRSVEPSPDRKQGFIRVMLVEITPDLKFLSETKEEIAAMETYLKNRLESTSSAMLNFRVLVKQ